MNLSEEHLITALRNGEDSAISEIYIRYWKKMVAVAYSQLRDQEDAQEVVQTVMISLWNRREGIAINSLENYLAKSVKYAVYKAFHKRKRKEQVLNSIAQESGSLDFSEGQIYAVFLQDYLNGQIEKLPEKCRLVFKYSREQGMTANEIANEMQIAQKTVEGHMTKAIKFLRLSLNQYSDLLAILLSLSALLL